MTSGRAVDRDEIDYFAPPDPYDRPSRSDLMKPLGLTAQEKSDLVAFMKTLTSNLSPTAVPVLPR